MACFTLFAWSGESVERQKFIIKNSKNFVQCFFNFHDTNNKGIKCSTGDNIIGYNETYTDNSSV